MWHSGSSTSRTGFGVGVFTAVVIMFLMDVVGLGSARLCSRDFGSSA